LKRYDVRSNDSLCCTKCNELLARFCAASSQPFLAVWIIIQAWDKPQFWDGERLKRAHRDITGVDLSIGECRKPSRGFAIKPNARLAAPPVIGMRCRRRSCEVWRVYRRRDCGDPIDFDRRRSRSARTSNFALYQLK